MNTLIHNLRLNVDKPNPFDLQITQSSNLSHTFNLALFYEDQPYLVGAYERVVCVFQRGDGTATEPENPASLSDNIITQVLDASVTSAPGLVRGEVRIYGESEELLVSSSFSFVCVRSVLESGVEADPKLPIITRLLQEAQQALDRANGLYAEAINSADITIEPDGFWYINGHNSGVEARGPKGEQGPRGLQGSAGPQGPQGIPGVSDIATQSRNGLMSSTDKAKLDGIAQNANNYVHPASHALSEVSGLQTALGAKVAKADIVDALTGTDPTKVLSAAQGKKLKSQVDDLAANMSLLKMTTSKNGDGVNPYMIVDFQIPSGYTSDGATFQFISNGAIAPYAIYPLSSTLFRFSFYSVLGAAISITTHVNISLYLRKA